MSADKQVRADVKAYIRVLRDCCMLFAELRLLLNRVEDAEVFDYESLGSYTQMAKCTWKQVLAYRKKLGMTGGYNFVEPFNLRGCRIEYGKVIGTPDQALSFAEGWVDDVPVPSGDCTLYELGTYLLFYSKAQQESGQ